MESEYQPRNEVACDVDEKTVDIRNSFSPPKTGPRTRRKPSKGTNPRPKAKKRPQQPVIAFPDPFLPGFAPHEVHCLETPGVTNSREGASFLNSPDLRFLTIVPKKPAASADAQAWLWEDLA